MNTRELAEALRDIATYLDTISPFDAESYAIVSEKKKGIIGVSIGYCSKEKFVDAVKAVGSATKEYTEGEYSQLQVTAKAFPLTVSISRDKVCKRVVKFECEPLFSNEELETL